MSESGMAAALAVISIGTTTYTSFCPPFPKVLAAEPDRRTNDQVRTAELFAGMVTLAAGLGLGLASGSKMPIAVAVSVVAVMTMVYEVSLQRRVGMS